jgi:hypothetical protein
VKTVLPHNSLCFIFLLYFKLLDFIFIVWTFHSFQFIHYSYIYVKLILINYLHINCPSWLHISANDKFKEINNHKFDQFFEKVIYLNSNNFPLINFETILSLRWIQKITIYQVSGLINFFEVLKLFTNLKKLDIKEIIPTSLYDEGWEWFNHIY